MGILGDCREFWGIQDGGGDLGEFCETEGAMGKLLRTLGNCRGVWGAVKDTGGD